MVPVASTCDSDSHLIPAASHLPPTYPRPCGISSFLTEVLHSFQAEVAVAPLTSWTMSFGFAAPSPPTPWSRATLAADAARTRSVKRMWCPWLHRTSVATACSFSSFPDTVQRKTQRRTTSLATKGAAPAAGVDPSDRHMRHLGGPPATRSYARGAACASTRRRFEARPYPCAAPSPRSFKCGWRARPSTWAEPTATRNAERSAGRHSLCMVAALCRSSCAPTPPHSWRHSTSRKVS